MQRRSVFLIILALFFTACVTPLFSETKDFGSLTGTETIETPAASSNDTTIVAKKSSSIGFTPLILAIILIAIVITAALIRRLNMPLIIIALGVGIIFGSDVTGLVNFSDGQFAQQVANIALVFILFAGGFGTKRDELRSVLLPSMLLATVGVLVTGLVTALITWKVLGWDFKYALLVSAIISSTDAAATFSILRTRAIKPRLSSLIEIESAANDPAAIISTTFIIQIILIGAQNPGITVLSFVWQLAGGVLFGILIGNLGAFIYRRLPVVDRGYYYILIIGLIFLSYGLPDICKTSGMLSAFFAGFIMGNAKFPYQKGISNFTGALSTIANTGLFVLLGLLVSPRQFASIWVQGTALFLVLTLVGRPISALLCTPFQKFSWRDKLFVSWSGIRGAVPIVLATYPVAAGLDPNNQIFNIIFFAVALSVLLQGTTIGKLADVLKLSAKAKPKPLQSMELVTIHDTDLELVEITIDEDEYEGEAAISTLRLPFGCSITMIARRKEIVVPHGFTIIRPGDSVFFLAKTSDLDKVNDELLSHFIEKEKEKEKEPKVRAKAKAEKEELSRESE